MPLRIKRLRPLLAVLVVTLGIAAATAPKRPLTHKDYASWRTITGQKLSSDGRYVAYFLFPQEGDGEFVVRDLKTGTERREPVGVRPQPPARGEPSEPTPEAAPTTRGPILTFSADSRYVLFSIYPSKAETEAARKEKKKPEEVSRHGMGIINLTTPGAAVRIEKVATFQIPEEQGALVVYHKQSPAPPSGEEETAEDVDQRRGASSRPATPARRTGSDLVVRMLDSGAERTLPEVTEFQLARDGKLLVFSVGAKEEEKNGVFALALDANADPRPLLAGKGRYTRLSWNEQQNVLAFLTDRGESPSRFRLYGWKRGAAEAEEWVGMPSPGLQNGFQPSERGAVSFSRDGSKVFFGCARPQPRSSAASQPSAADDERVVADLWHWKDGFIQPMQRVRAAQERNRTYRAVFHIQDKKLVQLAGPDMPEASPSEDGRWAAGINDLPYRSMVDYDTRYSDFYIVDTATGARRLAAQKRTGTPIWSPDGRYLLHYDDRQWHAIEAASGNRINLTEKLGVAFWNELYDAPGNPTAYGNGGWTQDGKYVLLYDQFDIWQVAPDGSSAECLTRGAGRRSRTQFRVVRLERDPRQRHIDPSKPLLLRAENIDTRDTGFWRTRIGAQSEPQRLLMGPKNYSAPAAAQKAEVYLLSASTFNEFPDLLVSGPDFKNLRKVSAANPQKEQLLWGTGELIRYKNLDGVPLSAALYKPENMEPGKKYPLLVYIYERLSQNVHNFVDPRPGTNINAAYYVSNGYLVLMPDIAYNIGYPGQSALKCVLPAIQAVVDRGIVDENAIGIQGHSWGGYQISYMVTQTNRFRAAAAGAPVANMTSAYSGIRWGPGLPRQWQYERAQSRIGGTLWQYPTRFLENSPVFMADRVKTPLLILHNDNDDAVPWYQGIEYFLALRRLGKEVYMFNYNGEPHGLRKRANQKDYTVRMQEFFDHHLKGAPAPAWMKEGIPYLEREREKERLKAIYEP
jgi:dipeptidyl aminopeptidase/acylaminoacyl peptidase